MKSNRSYQFAAVLILAAGLLAACHSGPAMTQYANDTDSKERLTLTKTINTKTRLISTFHGISMGSYRVANNDGVLAEGTFSRDDKFFEFKASDGTSLIAKVSNDETFEYLGRTWKPTKDYVLRPADLKALVPGAVKAAAADGSSR